MEADVLGIEDRTLTLAECIGIALNSNPRTRRTWQSSLSSAARVGEEKSAYLPRAELTSGATRADTVELNARENQGVSNMFDVGFGVRYLLFDGGTRSAQVEAAEADLLAANFRHNTTLQEVALAVEETYYGHALP